MKEFAKLVPKELVQKFKRACVGSKTTAEVAQKMGCDLETVKWLIKIFPETWKKDLSSDCEVDEKPHRKQESKDTNQDIYVIHSGICRYDDLANLLAILSQKSKFVLTKKTLDAMEILNSSYKRNTEVFRKCVFSNISCFDYKDVGGNEEEFIVKNLAMTNGWIILTADVTFAIKAKVEGCKVFCALGSEYRFESILKSLDYRGKKSQDVSNEKASESEEKMEYESTPNLIHEKRKKPEFDSIESIAGKVVERAKKIKDSIDTEAIKETFASVTAKVQDKAVEVSEAISEAKIAKNGLLKLPDIEIRDGIAIYKLPENTVAKVLYTWDEKLLKDVGSTASLVEGSILYTAELESNMVAISRYEVRENCSNLLYRDFYRKILTATEIADVAYEDVDLYAFAIDALSELKATKTN